MLNGIRLVDFGNHRDTCVTFGRMTALVGQNGAGKTNLLQGIMQLSNESYGNKEKVRSGASEWLASASWFGALRVTETKEQQGSWVVRVGSLDAPFWMWHAGLNEAEVWLPSPKDSWHEIPSWRYSLHREWPGYVTGEIRPGTTVRPEDRKRRSPWVSRYYKTAGSYLQGPSYSENSPPILSENCRDLAWMISYLKGDKDEVFAAITEALREVVPTFRRVKHRPVPILRLEKKEVVINKQPRLYDEEQRVMGQELRFDMASGSDLPASAISEGTLVTLAILTAIMHDDDPAKKSGTKTILLDDIESGLHPSAQRDLIRQLRRLQEIRPELQIIFSSHSPYILDEMQPEDVWLFAPDKDGIAHCAKLSEHPDAKRALGVLTTGEFWSAEGESWVLDPKQRATEEAAAVK